MSKKVDVEATRQETSAGLNWTGIEKPCALLAAHTSCTSEWEKNKAQAAELVQDLARCEMQNRCRTSATTGTASPPREKLSRCARAGPKPGPRYQAANNVRKIRRMSAKPGWAKQKQIK
jgi:hypothetical protein